MTGFEEAASDAAHARHLLQLLQADDVDGAIAAGLGRFVPVAALDDAGNRALADARDRLLAAWAARARHRARALRLERIAQERRLARPARRDADAGLADAREPSAAVGAGTAQAGTGDTPPRAALPAAAAAALARARARASGSTP